MRDVVFVGATDVVSGAERVMLNYASAAAAHGWRSRILAPAGNLGRECVELELAHRILPDLKLGDGPRALAAGALAVRNLRAVGTLRRSLVGADLVVVNSLMALPAVVAARPEAPVHWFVHDVVTRGDLERIVRAVAPRLDGAIAVSEAAGELARRLDVPTGVVQNGVAFPDRPAEPAPGLPIVGISGVLTPWKGQDVFLDAIARTTKPCRAEVLGGALPKDGDYDATLRRRAARPDLRERVRFLGHHTDPVEVMRQWTIGVSASREPEAGPLVVKEAMALGLAIVVTDHGGAPEAVGPHGLCVPPDDPAALASAIDRYLADPGLRERYGAGARARVDDELRLEAAIDRFYCRLDSLVPPLAPVTVGDGRVGDGRVGDGRVGDGRVGGGSSTKAMTEERR